LLSATFLSIFLAAITLVAPKFPGDLKISAILHSCSAVVLRHGQTHPDSVWTYVGTLVSAVLMGSLCAVVAVTHFRQRRSARRQLDRLQLVGRAHPEPDVLVLEHESMCAYCVDGDRKQVVVTNGALNALTADQWRQVLAHERAHLRYRHHTWVRLTSAFRTTFGGLLGSTAACARVAELVEMHADDAAELDRRWDLAAAVLLLGSGDSPAGALAAGGATGERVLRLTKPPRPLSGTTRRLVLAATTVLWLAPVSLVLAPGALSVTLGFCPSFPGSS
jgi:Zn-dependent protease with chaperone function